MMTREAKHSMMTGGARNMIDRVEQKTMTLVKAGEEKENGRGSNMQVPFAIDAKGEEKNGESMILKEHELLLSVAINDKGEIVGNC